MTLVWQNVALVIVPATRGPSRPTLLWLGGSRGRDLGQLNTRRLAAKRACPDPMQVRQRRRRDRNARARHTAPVLCSGMRDRLPLCSIEKITGLAHTAIAQCSLRRTRTGDHIWQRTVPRRASPETWAVV